MTFNLTANFDEKTLMTKTATRMGLLSLNFALFTALCGNVLLYYNFFHSKDEKVSMQDDNDGTRK